MNYDEWVKTECQPAYRPINGHENRIMRVAFNSAIKISFERCAEICEEYSDINNGSNDAILCAERIREVMR